jgi:hypothetical protein
MPVKAKTVQGRRDLSFQTLDDIVADVEFLVASPTTRTIGNWPLVKLITHLSQTVHNSIDGFQTKAPLIIRLVMPLFKGRFLKARKMNPGINLPKAAEAAAYPEAKSVQEALNDLRRAVERTRTESMTASHPAFGKMTHDEWNTLHLRHSEMHLSFAVTE